jgi:hypothetical protein
VAFGALFIKQRLGLCDEEIVEQIREHAYIQFFLGFAGHSSKKPYERPFRTFRLHGAYQDLFAQSFLMNLKQH